MGSSITRRIIAVLSVMLLGLLALAGCSSGGGSSSGSGASSSASVSTAASDSSSAVASSDGVPTSGNVVVMTLDNNAGTGYEWSYTVEPEGVLSFAGQRTEEAGGSEPLAGGQVQEVFEFRADAPGEAVVTFTLARPGTNEVDPNLMQMYAYTVTDDLNIILNPYKSNFDHEPEWPQSA